MQQRRSAWSCVQFTPKARSSRFVAFVHQAQAAHSEQRTIMRGLTGSEPVETSKQPTSLLNAVLQMSRNSVAPEPQPSSTDKNQARKTSTDVAGHAATDPCMTVPHSTHSNPGSNAPSNLSGSVNCETLDSPIADDSTSRPCRHAFEHASGGKIKATLGWHTGSAEQSAVEKIRHNLWEWKAAKQAHAYRAALLNAESKARTLQSCQIVLSSV